MSKRQGGELNHENWNQDQEPEDAGQFRQASSGDLKGRVIKTARRRKAVASEDATENKNVFSGFGGFANKAPDASSAFSFLGKPPETSATTNTSSGFVFGNSTAKPAETSGFSFGSLSNSSSSKVSFGGTTSETSEPVAKKSTAAFGSFGSNLNKKDDAEPLFGSSTSETKNEAPKFGSFAFGSKTEEKPPSAKLDENPKSDLMSMFKPAPGWSCTTCMVSNPVDKTSCLACETPKPGSKQQEKPVTAFGSSGGFSFGDTPKTASGGFSFGATVNKSEENKENSSTSGFSFGAKSTSSDKPAGFGFEAKEKPATEGFAFGGKSVDNTKDKPSNETFSFGSKSNESKKDEQSTGSFSFGAKSTETSESETSFAFGAKTNDQKAAPLGAFAFGVTSTKSVVDTEADKSKTGGFGLSVSEKTGVNSVLSPGLNKLPAASGGKTEDSNTSMNKPNLGKSSVETSQGPSNEYLAHLKALNLQVASWIQKHLQQNPLVLLSPVFNDYDKHLKEIETKYNKVSVSNKPETKTPSIDSSKMMTPTTTVFGKKSSSPLDKSTSSTTTPFNMFSNADKPVSSSAPFSFGLSTSSTSESKAPSLGGFSSGGFGFGSSSAIPSSQDKPKEDEDEDAPPVVEIKQVVEDEAIYSKKCKLFYKKEGSYVEKGVGMLYLKSVDGDKIQLLVRADTNLGNVLLNILLSSQIPTTRVGKNNVMLVCIPNPPVDPKADSSAPCPMLIRVKDGEAADELKTKIDECKEK